MWPTAAHYTCHIAIKTGKSISNLEIMDKLSAELKPDKFLVLKVSKSTLNYIRFEAEMEQRKHLRVAIERLDGASLRLSSFSESFRVRCTEAKDEFPTRHDWDSYFRDARNMDEMKAGERPDTIHLTHLPIRWFCPRHSEHDENVKPSESIFKRIFEKYGRVRAVDIPICDPYRKSMGADINGMRTFSFEQDVLFEAYVQFEEYSSFVRAMDEIRGTKLVRKFLDKTQAINIIVNFDKEKHLSDSHIQRRERIRKRMILKAQAEDEERERKKKQEAEQLERERQKQEQLKLAELEKQREREEKRKEKHLKKIQERGQVEISQKIRIEERKLMIAQRKLESIRILEQVFERIQLKEKSKQRSRHQHDKHHDDSKDLQRGRLVEKYKTATEKLVCDQRKIVQEIKSKTPLMGLLKSKTRKSNANNSSSDDEDAEDTTKKHKIKNGTSNSNAGEQANVAGIGAVPPVPAAAAQQVLNPFKAVAALAAGAVPAAATAAYTAEAANEWMQSLSMFGYGMPGVFPGALYRPPLPFPVSSNYRGFAPRARGRGRGRGSRGGRGGYDGHSSSYYNPRHYDGDRYDDDEGGDSYYHRSNRNRSRSSSYSRSRSRSRGRRRSHSRSRSRSYYRKSSYSSRSRRSRSRSHSRSRSKTPAQRNNRKLASTRRSRSTSYSRSRSRSHSYVRSKRSTSRSGGRNRRSRSRSSRRSSRNRSTSSKRLVLETDKLVRSAEHIQRTIEQHTKDRMREEEREIKQNFRHRGNSSNKLYDNHVDVEVPEQYDTIKTKDTDKSGNASERSDSQSNRKSRRNSLAA
ncbi:A-kinase anchor protein 17A isoform X2 [Scaptodrosophila lebanonensis]|uniref:A-kinase anchor protein 17A isoform X2 n=1 Tax=Drosophila lebanonensis TaxID=7225 RepID=A0A6J2TKV3_DROLE|nr:A-kinase anchor protein 17A isoform X2 [Scaptodrosophila lebanonensis]